MTSRSETARWITPDGLTTDQMDTSAEAHRPTVDDEKPDGEWFETAIEPDAVTAAAAAAALWAIPL